MPVTITVTIESGLFAEFITTGKRSPRYYVEMVAGWWHLHSSEQPAFRDPIRRFRPTGDGSIYQVIPKCMSAIIDTIASSDEV